MSKKKAKQLKRVCFDMETELFSEEFRYARGTEDRLHHAPKMRVACAFDGVRWRYFLPSEAAELIGILLDADEVISFNGKEFDELVLRRHHGLTGSLPRKGDHIDLFAIIREKENKWISLDRLAELNLGEKKHTKGRDTQGLDLEPLKAACRSDVWQTYRLWELWCKGQLQIPEQRTGFRWERRENFSDVGPGPGHHMPTICPKCHAIGTLSLMECDTDEMSEGQETECLAGTWGFAFCEACESEVFWEM